MPAKQICAADVGKPASPPGAHRCKGPARATLGPPWTKGHGIALAVTVVAS